MLLAIAGAIIIAFVLLITFVFGCSLVQMSLGETNAISFGGYLLIVLSLTVAAYIVERFFEHI